MTAAAPAPAPVPTAAPPEAIVRAFLLALQGGDLDTALALLDEDVVYENVSLPTIRTRRGVERLARVAFGRAGLRFRVHFRAVAANGGTVLTDRIDALGAGRFEQRFWVYGRFEVRDGRITLWRDAFDWGDITVSLLRGAAGVVVPALNRPWPTG